MRSYELNYWRKKECDLQFYILNDPILPKKVCRTLGFKFVNSEIKSNV